MIAAYRVGRRRHTTLLHAIGRHIAGSLKRRRENDHGCLQCRGVLQCPRTQPRMHSSVNGTVRPTLGYSFLCCQRSKGHCPWSPKTLPALCKPRLPPHTPGSHRVAPPVETPDRHAPLLPARFAASAATGCATGAGPAPLLAENKKISRKSEHSARGKRDFTR